MNDDQLRSLLTDAVADVEPTRDLDLATRPRRTAHWLPVTVAAALATVLVVTGTAWLLQRDETPSTAATSPTASGGPAEVPVVVWQAVSTPAGTRLTADRRLVGSDDPVQAAVADTVRAFTGDADVVVTVDENAAVPTVDLSVGAVDTFETDPTSPPELVPQAVAWTIASATDSTGPVRLTMNGSAESRWFDTDLARPVVPDPAVLAPVSIESVGNDETVSSPFTVSGLAATFEGTVTWKLVRQEQTVREGFATAAECCTATPYSFTVTAPPGSYTLEVRETDPSDGEGAAPFGVVRQVTVR